jgi:methylated-DNA-[protein]-cysteine S-methyltransferase
MELICSTPLGPLRLRFTSGGLASLAFLPEAEVHAPPLPAAPAPGPATAPHLILEALSAYFTGKAIRPATLPLDLQGTPFQLRVWRELMSIPPGTTISYVELARRLGKPRGARAVGQAVGANPIPILIPCHRVIAADGGLGGYSSGLERKRRLLALEGVRR